ncbi:MAG: hypothetical protein N3F67_02535 [Acidilobaceae archaeon]|nr:hypothetical protein [Acidilobaceae archaeon]
MRSTRVALVAAVLAALLSFPLLDVNASAVAQGFDVTLGIVMQREKQTMENFAVFMKTLAAMLAFLTTIVAAVTLSASVYAFALAITVITVNPGVMSNPLLLLPLFAYSVMDVLVKGWRRGQLTSLGGPRSLAISFLLTLSLLSALFALAWLSSEVIWKYFSLLRGLEVSSPFLSIFSELLFKNPIGLSFVIGLALMLIYGLARELAEALVAFVRPSPKAARDALLSMDLEAPIKPPLSSLRNALVSLAVSPPLYYLLYNALLLLPVQLSFPYDVLLRFVVAALVFVVSWFLISRLTASFEEREPSLLSPIAGLMLILATYGLLYALALWEPSSGLSPEAGDDVLRKAILSYYETIVYMGELLLVFMGVAP